MFGLKAVMTPASLDFSSVRLVQGVARQKRRLATSLSALTNNGTSEFLKQGDDGLVVFVWPHREVAVYADFGQGQVVDLRAFEPF